MRLARLSLALIASSLVAMVGLATFGAWTLGEVREHQQELDQLTHLQVRLDDLSAASDALLLSSATASAYESFQREARAVQDALAQRADTDPAAEQAVGAIGEMLALADRYAGPGSASLAEREGGQGALGVPREMAEVMSRMAALGGELDSAMDAMLRAHFDIENRALYVAVLGFFGAALAFALLSLAALGLLHRRLGAPVGRLAAVVDRVAGGDEGARADVSGHDEVARLGAGLNAMLDRQAATHAQLAERERMLAESQRIARIGTWYRKLGTDAYVWTREAYRIFGHAPNSFRPSSASLYELVHRSDRANVEALHATLVEGEGRGEGRFRIVRADGEIRHVQLYGERLHDENGRPMSVSGTVQDVTELVEAHDAVGRQGELLEMAGRMASIGGWSVDLGTGEITWSDTVCEIHDEPPGTRPTPQAALAYYPPEHRPRISRAMERASAEGTPIHEELQIVTAKNRRVWVRVVGEPVRDTNGVVVAVRGAIQDIEAEKQAELELEKLAHTDRTTGLYSRDGLVRMLQERLDAGDTSPSAILASLDLRELRNVNEAHGYAVGDALLGAVGRRLQARAGPGGLVARTGGDGFAALVPSEGPPGDVVRMLVGRSDGMFADPFHVAGVELTVAMRVGYTQVSHQSRDAEALLRESEISLHAAKHGVNANGQAYTEALHEATRARVRLVQELGAALEQEQFVLHYQPQVDLTTGRLVACEALIRWQHPERGLVPPGMFIGVAEQSGRIGPMGSWVLGEACRTLRNWEDEGLDPVRLAINVSVEQLRDGDFVRDVRASLARHELDPGALIVEITESVFAYESRELRAQLHALHELGVQIALDDFGTGFSSLAYLRDYPFDRIKIDRAFVGSLPEDPFGRSVVTSVLGLATSIGAHTIAEGIETRAQRDALLRLGCSVGQGFYFSRPLEQAAFRRLLVARERLPLDRQP
ncbi:MAG: EAL domain-containing protein [Trueperaceae bacterium]|nr:EAL domain-containing protein [Trueperaceae bacterium]